MTKIIEKAADLDFGFVDEFENKTLTGAIENIGTERITLSNLISSKPDQFIVNSFDQTIQPKFPASSTLYFGENGKIQDSNGAFYTSDQGFGVIGSTDADGELTINYSLPSLSITSPLSTAKFKLSDTIQVNWSSAGVNLVDIIIESATGIKTYSGIDATLGTYNCSISSADLGDFQANQEITIAIEATLGSANDSVNVNTIATITIDTISSQTAGTAFDVTGDSNGDEVEVFYRVAGGSPENAWVSAGTASVSDGNYTKSVTIASAETYDFKVEDTTDSDGNAQQDNVVVASGRIFDSLQFGGSGDDWIMNYEELTDGVLVAGITQSTTLFSESTGWTTGYVRYLARLNKSGVKQWVIFSGDDAGYSPAQNFCVVGNYAYWINESTKLSKVDLTDGSVVSSRNDYDLTGTAITRIDGVATDGSQILMGFIVYGNLYFGTTDTSFADIDKQSQQRSGTDAYVRGIFSQGSNKWIVVWKKTSGSTSKGYIAQYDTTGGTRPYYIELRYISDFVGFSEDRVLVICYKSDYLTRVIRSYSLSAVNWTTWEWEQTIDTPPQYYTEKAGGVVYDGTDFVCVYFDGTDIKVRKVSDASSYSIVGTEKTLTTDTGTFPNGDLTRSLDDFILGQIDGKITSDATDAGGNDAFMYKIESLF